MNDILRNSESKIRLFAGDCIVCGEILSIKDVEILRTYLDRLGDRAEDNGMKMNMDKSKAQSCTTARGKDPLDYSIGDQRIPETSFSKYL